MLPALPKHLNRPLETYLQLLDQWNRTHALTALPIGERREELLLDSCSLLPFLAPLPEGARVVDFGTGMGCPGVLLALARPDLEVLGVDASKKKVAFVRQVALELPVPNLRLIHGRFDEIPPLEAHWGTAKALAPLGTLAHWWHRHGRPGCPFYALKGEDWGREPMPEGWQAQPHPYSLPTRGNRVVVELRPTP